MTRTSSLTLSAAVLMASLGAFAAPAFAQAQDTETNRRVDMFERFDADGDGAVTREEMEQAQNAAREAREARRSQNEGRPGGRAGVGEQNDQRRDMFERLDADGDGAVTREEMEQGRAAAKEAREARQSQRQGRPGGRPGAGAMAPFQQTDNGQRGDMFERLDADGDGALTREEMQQAEAAAKEARETRRTQNRERRGGQARPGAMAHFQQADADSDGALSRSELLARHEARVERMIERLDADEDGLLSPEEMREGFGKKRHPGPRR